ncbi:MAG: Uma2 family endonuclease [Thermomicrobiales bacterium]
MAIQLPRRRFTVSDYEQMAAAGILGEDDWVELIAGEIVEMSPIGGRHIACVNTLGDTCYQQVRTEVLISVQNPIRLGPEDEPQPDLALLVRRPYGRAVPTAADVLLVIEVSDTTRERDRSIKLPRYAAAGIPEAWLFDLTSETIERHSEPRGGRYSLIAVAGRGDTLTSTVLPALTIDVDAILGSKDAAE